MQKKPKTVSDKLLNQDVSEYIEEQLSPDDIAADDDFEVDNEKNDEIEFQSFLKILDLKKSESLDHIFNVLEESESIAEDGTPENIKEYDFKLDAIDISHISEEADYANIVKSLLNKLEWPKNSGHIIYKYLKISNIFGELDEAISLLNNYFLSWDELSAIYNVNVFWLENEIYNIDFRNYKNCAIECEIKLLPWEIILALIKCYETIPDEEEIKICFDEMYSRWLNNPYLINEYLSFNEYVRYRAGMAIENLKLEPLYLFENDIYPYRDDDSDYAIHDIHNKFDEKWLHFNIDIYKYDKPAYNYYYNNEVSKTVKEDKGSKLEKELYHNIEPHEMKRLLEVLKL